MALLRYVYQPVKVILFGTAFGINVNYLDIACQTPGSIHTFKNGVYNLADLKEGDTVDIGNETFRLIHVKFTRIIKM